MMEERVRRGEQNARADAVMALSARARACEDGVGDLVLGGWGRLPYMAMPHVGPTSGGVCGVCVTYGGLVLLGEAFAALVAAISLLGAVALFVPRQRTWEAEGGRKSANETPEELVCTPCCRREAAMASAT